MPSRRRRSESDSGSESESRDERERKKRKRKGSRHRRRDSSDSESDASERRHRKRKHHSSRKKRYRSDDEGKDAPRAAKGGFSDAAIASAPESAPPDSAPPPEPAPLVDEDAFASLTTQGRYEAAPLLSKPRAVGNNALQAELDSWQQEHASESATERAAAHNESDPARTFGLHEHITLTLTLTLTLTRWPRTPPCARRGSPRRWRPLP